MAKLRVHPDFHLNGNPLKVSELKKVAVDFVETGEQHEEEVGHFLLSWLDDKKYVLVNTSGSTGNPKEIRLLKKHMVNSAKATAKRLKLPEKTTALLCLPSRYIGGKMMLVRAMVLGWKIDLVPPKSNPLDAVFKRYDFCAMIPFQLDNSINRLHLVSKLIIGGGVFSEALKNKVQDIDTKIFETYGMTETISHIAIRRVNANNENSNSVRPFKALKNVSFASDSRGCLVIKAPKVSTDPVITNDVVELLSYKKFLLLGRIDNVVNSGGIKLYPEHIETKLSPQIEVPFFLAGEPDIALGEKLILVIESEAIDGVALDFAMLDKYEIPKAVYFIPNFERTGNGKLRRGATLKKLNSAATSK
ncbi:AMP-binding protein [Flavimarina sp. Hel_I_48]|uniref:AMP-binding protein n=1 Tax=Flavimarina sp. Hel_I_48 TaxID=1392488 RepID=UPI0004DF7E98|nr:AMP-binding protein [Flavimarina sp. Hel_I_48]